MLEVTRSEVETTFLVKDKPWCYWTVPQAVRFSHWVKGLIEKSGSIGIKRIGLGLLSAQVPGLRLHHLTKGLEKEGMVRAYSADTLGTQGRKSLG